MTENPIFAEIQNTISAHDIVLYMKGNAKFPMCGFSGTVIQILKNLDVPFYDVDVLQSPEIREGIKAFTQWPTIPQLYIKGEFVGGCDIVREMFETGELQTLLKEKGVVKA
ncbi:Grx4 family monothiol glutaredoxin [Candidatus Bealeia paramacronuclearis]|uniref:Glutaredoxin n=1 Tax=Candidatus Bealeia paramacronuclearis TaxID=1921001 RepID=A0ABZ2C693_9PROT|nr:Grx4 family monothiol glutaredoxin [Candidatus Bealeia paramacronuclearis]